MKKMMLLLFIIPFICAAESAEMSITAAVDMALKNNIDLKNSNLTLSNKKLTAASSWNSILRKRSSTSSIVFAILIWEIV